MASKKDGSKSERSRDPWVNISENIGKQFQSKKIEKKMIKVKECTVFSNIAINQQCGVNMEINKKGEIILTDDDEYLQRPEHYSGLCKYSSSS